MFRPLALLALALSAGLVLLGMPSFSGASYVTASANTTSSVSASSDWTPPTVSVRNPGTSVKGTVTVTADASDGESGVADVVIQHRAVGGSTWTTLCTTTTAPYSCSWNTTTVADGGYDLRARATDRAGYSTVSDTVRTTVANNLVVALTRPADAVRGTVALTTTLSGTGSLTYQVDVQYVLAGGTDWRTITGCAGLASPYTCSWVTGSLANNVYDLRAVAVTGTTSTTSNVVADIEVDNAAPTVTMTDPGSPLRGSVTFAANAADAHSGIANVVLQYAATGSSTWRDLCTDTIAPYSCTFDTTGLADGSYSLRAVATDFAGNTTTSATIANRVVDNTVSSVSLNDPGTYLNATVTLTAVASSSAGVTSVRIQRAPNGSSTWTDLCTDTTSPYTCSWNTTGVADGTYSLRAVLLDGSGKTTISTVSNGHIVDNTPLRAVDVQTTGTGTLGRLSSGDVMTLTYSEQVNLSSLSAGWNGSGLAVAVRLRDGGLLGTGTTGDTVDVLRSVGSSTVVPLGSVRLNQDYVNSNATAVLNATMTASTVTVNGVPSTRITLTMGSVASGSTSLRTVTATSTMQWTPSTAATDLSGLACSSALATETGAADREF